jgi:hypothetical protein
LSNVHHPSNLKPATDLIATYKRTGNVFITTTGDAGLSLYAASPGALKQILIDTFKHNPRAVIGISRSHLIVHSVKALHKYGLVSLLIPLSALALLLSFLPAYLIWTVLVGSIITLASTIGTIFKPKERRPQS